MGGARPTTALDGIAAELRMLPPLEKGGLGAIPFNGARVELAQALGNKLFGASAPSPRRSQAAVAEVLIRQQIASIPAPLR